MGRRAVGMRKLQAVASAFTIPVAAMTSLGLVTGCQDAIGIVLRFAAAGNANTLAGIGAQPAFTGGASVGTGGGNALGGGGSPLVAFGGTGQRVNMALAAGTPVWVAMPNGAPIPWDTVEIFAQANAADITGCYVSAWPVFEIDDALSKVPSGAGSFFPDSAGA